MPGYWLRSFFCVFMDLNSVSVDTNTPKKKNLANIQPYYTTQAVTGPITKFNQSKCLLPVQYSLSIGPGIVPNDPALVSLLSSVV